MSEITRHLEQMIGIYSGVNSGLSIEEFVLTNGRAYKAAERPTGIRQGVMRQCFKNATELHLKCSKRYSYCEGYALNIIPVLHAWCVDQDGNVVDPTWPDQQDCQYYGVEIPRQYLVRTMIETEHYGILDNYKEGFPLMSGRHRLDDPNTWFDIKVVDTIPERGKVTT